jgi:hypothetical protein
MNYLQSVLRLQNISMHLYSVISVSVLLVECASISYMEITQLCQRELSVWEIC